MNMFEGVQDQFHHFLAAAAVVASSSLSPPTPPPPPPPQISGGGGRQLVGASNSTIIAAFQQHDHPLSFSLHGSSAAHNVSRRPASSNHYPPIMFDPFFMHHHGLHYSTEVGGEEEDHDAAAAGVVSCSSTTTNGGGGGGGGGTTSFLSTMLQHHHHHHHHHQGRAERSSSSSSPSPSPLSMVLPSSDPWSNEEVIALFRIRSAIENNNWFPEFTWEHVSRKLAEIGFERNAQKCREKFEEESTRICFTSTAAAAAANGTSTAGNSTNIHHTRNNSTTNYCNTLFSELDELYDHHSHQANASHHHLDKQQPPAAGVHVQPFISENENDPTIVVSLSVSDKQNHMILQHQDRGISAQEGGGHIEKELQEENAAAADGGGGSGGGQDKLETVTILERVEENHDQAHDHGNINLKETPDHHPMISMQLQMQKEEDPTTVTAAAAAAAVVLVGTRRKGKKRKRSTSTHGHGHLRFEMFKRLCEEMVRKMMAQQEQLHNRILEDMVRRDQEKVTREEAWKKLEKERFEREMESRSRERAVAADRQAKIIEFLNNFSSINNNNNKTKAKTKTKTKTTAAVKEDVAAANTTTTITGTGTSIAGAGTTNSSTSSKQQQQLQNPSFNSALPATSGGICANHQDIHSSSTSQTSSSSDHSHSTNYDVPVMFNDNTIQLPSSNSSQYPATNPLPLPRPPQPPRIVKPNNKNIRTLVVGTGQDSTGKRWPRDEVLALINVRCNIDRNNFQINNNDDDQLDDGGSGSVGSGCTRPSAPLWERISQKMIEMGYNRSAKRCKEKWENINKYFRKTKDTKKKRAVDSRTCPYFHQLTNLYSQQQQQQQQQEQEQGKIINTTHNSITSTNTSTAAAVSDQQPLEQFVGDYNQGENINDDNATATKDN